MPRYVVLEHDHPARHWDLMLEAGDVLRTWRLAAPPGADQPIGATATFEHRLAYLDYEGPISGGRGQSRYAMTMPRKPRSSRAPILLTAPRRSERLCRRSTAGPS